MKKLEERKDVGRALAPEEKSRLLAAANDGRSATLPVFPSHRAPHCDAVRRDHEFFNGRESISKDGSSRSVERTSSGTGRQIPINEELLDVLLQYRNWYEERFGRVRPEWYVFPFGKPTPSDPTRPITTIKTA